MEQRETRGGRQLFCLPRKTSTRLIWPDSAIAKLSEAALGWAVVANTTAVRAASASWRWEPYGKPCAICSAVPGVCGAAADVSVYRARHGPRRSLRKISNKARSVKCWEAPGTSLCRDGFQQEKEGCWRSQEDFPSQIMTGLGSDSPKGLPNISFKGGRKKVLQTPPVFLLLVPTSWARNCAGLMREGCGLQQGLMPAHGSRLPQALLGEQAVPGAIFSSSVHALGSGTGMSQSFTACTGEMPKATGGVRGKQSRSSGVGVSHSHRCVCAVKAVESISSCGGSASPLLMPSLAWRRGHPAFSPSFNLPYAVLKTQQGAAEKFPGEQLDATTR